MPPERNATFDESRASATVPLVTCEPFSAVRPLPLPAKLFSGFVIECDRTKAEGS